MLSAKARPELLATYQPERDPHVRGVIGAAVAAGRYICQLDPALAARRDMELRATMAAAQPGATAADLIPRYKAGVVRPGAGERFIQPDVVGQDGRRGLLDDIIGSGWRLLSLATDPLKGASPRSRAAWQALGGLSFSIGAAGLGDPDGALTDWLVARGAAALLLRPDAYVYGVVDSSNALNTLLDQLADDLHLLAVDAGKEPA